MTFKKERHLALQVITGNQQERKGGFELRFAEIFGQDLLGAVREVFRSHKFPQGLKKPRLKDGCAVLDVKADQLLRCIGLALIAGGSNANGDDSARGGTRNQVIRVMRWFTNALLQGKTVDGKVLSDRVRDRLSKVG